MYLVGLSNPLSLRPQVEKGSDSCSLVKEDRG